MEPPLGQNRLRHFRRLSSSMDLGIRIATAIRSPCLTQRFAALSAASPLAEGDKALALSTPSLLASPDAQICWWLHGTSCTFVSATFEPSEHPGFLQSCPPQQTPNKYLDRTNIRSEQRSGAKGLRITGEHPTKNATCSSKKAL